MAVVADVPACPNPVLDPCGELVNEILRYLSPKSALSDSSSRRLSSFPQLSATRKGEGEQH